MDVWPFRRRRPVSKCKKAVERLVTGLIIGGAIGSIVGRKLIEEDEEDGLDEANESEDDEA